MPAWHLAFLGRSRPGARSHNPRPSCALRAYCRPCSRPARSPLRQIRTSFSCHIRARTNVRIRNDTAKDPLAPGSATGRARAGFGCEAHASGRVPRRKKPRGRSRPRICAAGRRPGPLTRLIWVCLDSSRRAVPRPPQPPPPPSAARGPAEHPPRAASALSRPRASPPPFAPHPPRPPAVTGRRPVPPPVSGAAVARLSAARRCARGLRREPGGSALWLSEGLSSHPSPFLPLSPPSLLGGKVEIQAEILNPWRYAAIIAALTRRETQKWTISAIVPREIDPAIDSSAHSG